MDDLQEAKARSKQIFTKDEQGVHIKYLLFTIDLKSEMLLLRQEVLSSMPKSILKLFFSIAICQDAGLIGTVFTVSSIENWYNLLNQPSFRPPNSLFGPVWTILYTLMGISLYWIWIDGTKKKEVRDALRLFAVHLALNASWSIVFFGMHNIFLSLVNIIILWILIIMVMIKFYRIEKKASLILLPYLAWVSFAAILNYNIFLLNR